MLVTTRNRRNSSRGAFLPAVEGIHQEHDFYRDPLRPAYREPTLRLTFGVNVPRSC